MEKTLQQLSKSLKKNMAAIEPRGLALWREAYRLGKQPLPVRKIGSTYYYDLEQDEGQRRYNIVRNQMFTNHPVINWLAEKLDLL